MTELARKLRVTAFPGGFNLALWAAIEIRTFAAQRLEIEPHYTTSSMEQLAGLVRGDWDLGFTSFDNIVAYQEGQGEAEISGNPDLFAFMGGDDAFLRFVVQDDVQSYAALKGRKLAVDALTTGFVFVLREMLKANGVSEGDVAFERAGGAVQRFQALKERRFAGALLLTPFELMGAEHGLRVLQNASDVIPRYQGVVGVARRSWAASNQDALVGFIRAYRGGLDWLFRRENMGRAAELLRRNVPNLDDRIAKQTCEILLSPSSGFQPEAKLDEEGMRTVLRLRSEYGVPRKVLADPAVYVDQSFYLRAID
jgi:ABC-type nitrate/sulfonate/bicarbonate transport system substrate-binding protein